jgi:hypothetical protein
LLVAVLVRERRTICRTTNVVPQKDIGSQSPAKGSAKEQHIAGASSGPQGEQTPSPTGGKQPPQTSNRRSKKHEHLPYETKSFTPEEDPDQQGDQSSAESVRERSSLQGHGGRTHGPRTE